MITSEGFGKRTDPELFTRKGRAGLGVRCVKVNEQRGKVVEAMFVAADDEILLISEAGVVIRTGVTDISQQGRDATGVRVMNLDDDDQVSAVARLFSVEGEDEVEVEVEDSEDEDVEPGDDGDRADTIAASDDAADTDTPDDSSLE